VPPEDPEGEEDQRGAYPRAWNGHERILHRRRWLDPPEGRRTPGGRAEPRGDRHKGVCGIAGYGWFKPGEI